MVAQAISRVSPPQLFVNDGRLEPEDVGILPQWTPDTPIEKIREQLQTDGYAIIKGLLPRADVLKAREEYFKLLSPSGFLKPGTEAVEGIFDSANDRLDYPGIGAGEHGPAQNPEIAAKFLDLAMQAHLEPWYKDRFCKHPALLSYVEKVTGWGDDTLAAQRTLLRNNTPGNKAIGVHYDHIFLRHGEDTFLTAWVPIGDIAIDGGGLIYLEKGHTLGTEIEQDFAEKAKACGMTDDEAKNAFNQNMMTGGVLTNGTAEFGREYKRRWMVSDYEAGDVVLHNAYAIHASTVNHDAQGVIRLATDLRFVDSKRPWDERWANSFKLGDGV